jgi:hypothetical protein
MRALLAVLALAVCGGVALANGEVFRYDPKTGVILPGKPTAARVERETLTIEFVPQEGHLETLRRAEVSAEYVIANPSAKPLALDIGFPISGAGPTLTETPVMLDGNPVGWRLVEYEELIRPLAPSLVRAVRAWQRRHPRAMELAARMRSLGQQELPRGERVKQEEELWRELRAELVKAGVEAPSRNAADALRPTVGEEYGKPQEARSQDVWALRKALRETGQRELLPEGRWDISETMVDPGTGRDTRPVYADSYSPTVTILTFSLHLDAGGRHTLAVRYRQGPWGNEEWGWPDQAYQFQYVLRTTRGWAAFGPIDVTVKAPSPLVLRSLPKLRFVGASGEEKVYQATLRHPSRNLQIVLAKKDVLLPRLKVNGQIAGRYDMLVGGSAAVPRQALPGWLEARMIGGEVTLRRLDVTVQAIPGEKQMVVFGETRPLATPLVVRRGVSYLPVEMVQALFPESNVTLTYHKPSNTVLLSIKPPPLQ